MEDLSDFRKGVFVTLGLAIAVWAFCLADCPLWVHVLAAISAVLVLFKLLICAGMYSISGSVCWMFVQYAIFITICSRFCYYNTELGVNLYAFAILRAAIVSVIMYSIVIPIISYWMGLLPYYDFNSCVITVFVYIAMFASAFIYETKITNDIMDNIFEREVFVEITRWKEEVINHDTYYIVWCERGTFSISPSEYPEIRDINDKTQIRVLKAKHRSSLTGTDGYTHLEIKNY